MTVIWMVPRKKFLTKVLKIIPRCFALSIRVGSDLTELFGRFVREGTQISSRVVFFLYLQRIDLRQDVACFFDGVVTDFGSIGIRIVADGEAASQFRNYINHFRAHISKHRIL
mmetsp:Transcript_15122/g.43695  ORF Transcript_15122/g.43695 Transcript_15122/m.43695 type:complete len:113 (+) Transcript_15122:151-489(+)